MNEDAITALVLTLIMAGLWRVIVARWAVVTKIVDGDTVHIRTWRKTLTVRLYGIDAPERDQPYGKEATEELSRLLPLGCIVAVKVRGKDRDRDIVAEIYRLSNLQSVSVNMVKAGAAHWYEDYAPQDKRLFNAEVKAIRNKCGLWSRGRVIEPKQWRRR